MTNSVVLCTYNGEKFIKEQLLSIIHQTLKVDEIIINDDGSQDNTIDIIKQIKSENNDIDIEIFQNNKQLGVTKNFENAINKAHGDIIFFSDQDDIWCENKVENFIKKFNENKSTVVFSDAYLLKDGEILNYSCWDSFGFNFKQRSRFRKSQMMAILKGWFVTGATMAAKKDFLNKIMPFPDFLLHDQWISLCAANDNTLDYIEDKLIKYRQHSEQVVGGTKDSISEQFKKPTDYLEQKQIYIKIRDRFKEMGINNSKGLDDKIKFLGNRDKALKYNFIKRAFYNFSLFNGYRKFGSGILKSYSKDLFRKDI